MFRLTDAGHAAFLLVNQGWVTQDGILRDVTFIPRRGLAAHERSPAMRQMETNEPLPFTVHPVKASSARIHFRLAARSRTISSVASISSGLL